MLEMYKIQDHLLTTFLEVNSTTYILSHIFFQIL